MERMRMTAPDRLDVDITVEDPVMLTRPFSVHRTFLRRNKMPQTDGAYCEGGRLEMTEGVQHLVLPSERRAQQQQHDAK
jgi:hypothetical protein